MRLFRIRLLHVETINWNGRYANIQPLRFTWWRSRLRWLRATVSIDRNRRIDLRRRRMLPTEHNEQICPLCGYLPVPSITSIGGVQFDFFRLSICPHRGRQNLRRTPPSEWDDGRNDTGQTQLTDKMSVSEIHAATTKESTFENMKMTVEMKKVRRSKKKIGRRAATAQHAPKGDCSPTGSSPSSMFFVSLYLSLSLSLPPPSLLFFVWSLSFLSARCCCCCFCCWRFLGFLSASVGQVNGRGSPVHKEEATAAAALEGRLVVLLGGLLFRPTRLPFSEFYDSKTEDAMASTWGPSDARNSQKSSLFSIRLSEKGIAKPVLNTKKVLGRRATFQYCFQRNPIKLFSNPGKCKTTQQLFLGTILSFTDFVSV